MTSLTKFEISILVLALVLAGGGYAWVHFMSVSAPTYSATNTADVVLRKTNPAYAQAQTLFNSGQYDDAYRQFAIALQDAQDPIQAGQIEYKEALSMERSGTYSNYLQAIPIYEKIAANAAYTRITRGAAVQEMGQIYYTYGDVKVTNAIFSVAPYQSMLVPGDDVLTYRHLFEYSISLYPAAISEIRVADWYAGDIKKRAAVSKTDPVIATEKEKISNALAAADKDVARIRNNPNEAPGLPGILMRKAVVIAKMTAVGDTSYGDWDQSFKTALDSFAVYAMSGGDGYCRFYYAHYIQLLGGTGRAADVATILAPFYSSNGYANTPVTKFMANEKTNVLHAKSQLIALAEADTKFKVYLMSLGWTASDFAK